MAFEKLRGKKSDAQIQNEIKSVLKNLDTIYSNKSSDEYKMAGDITKSPVYDKIQRMIADLTVLRGMNKVEIDDIKKMFNLMHRPVFKTTVGAYITKHDDSNLVPVILFTIGYRVLLGELARIYSSTEATEKGFVYKPDKISKKNSMMRFIHVFNTKLDTELTKFVRNTTKPVVKQEFYTMEGFVGSAARVAGAFAVIADRIAPFFEEIGAWLDLLHLGKILNPVSFINSLLTSKYDKKVAKFDEMSDMYLATKEAYDEYMKLPAVQRNKKIESKYIKNMEKYNIKMNNAAAKIAHYDQRSVKETMDAAREESERSASSSSTTAEPSTSSSSSSSDDFDF